MSGANVRSIQALTDMRTALLTFADQAKQAMESVRQETQRTLEALAERERFWRGRVNTIQANLQQAQAALRSCLSQPVRDAEGRAHPPNCAAQEAALRRVQDALRDAQDKLQRAHGIYTQTQQAANEFLRHMQRMSGALAEIPKATALLAQKISILEGYTGSATPSRAEARPAEQAPAEHHGILEKAKGVAQGAIIGGVILAKNVTALTGGTVGPVPQTAIPDSLATPPEQTVIEEQPQSEASKLYEIAQHREEAVGDLNDIREMLEKRQKMEDGDLPLQYSDPNSGDGK